MKPHALLLPCLLTALLSGCGARGPVPDGTGTIECTEVRVAPLVGGRIIELPPREGAGLKPDDLVARIDPRDCELRREEARAAVNQAQAQLDLLKAGSREEDIARARAQVREARAAADAAASDRRRIEEVHAKGSATGKQLDDARAAAERAQAALAGAEQQLLRTEKGSREEDIRVAEMALAYATAKLAVAEKAVKDTQVVAPMSGTVTARIHEVGDVVPAGAALITLARLDEVWLSVYIPEPRLAGVKLGQPARVKVDGQTSFHEGTVTYISPEAEFTPRNTQTADERAKLVYRVKITLPNRDGIFKPGLPAEAFLNQEAGPAPMPTTTHTPAQPRP